MTGKIIKRQYEPSPLKPGFVSSTFSDGDTGKTNTKRERLMALLRVRYGYTNEKAVDELKILLKQFYSTNKSLGVRDFYLDFEHSRVD